MTAAFQSGPTASSLDDHGALPKMEVLWTNGRPERRAVESGSDGDREKTFVRARTSSKQGPMEAALRGGLRQLERSANRAPVFGPCSF